MTFRSYRIWRFGTTGAAAAAAAAGIVVGNVYVVLIAIAAEFALLIFLRRRLSEIVEDERTCAVAYKAARLTVALVGIGMALAGAALLAAARQDFTSTSAYVGFTLEFTTCALLVVNQFAYHYYSRKMSGR